MYSCIKNHGSVVLLLIVVIIQHVQGARRNGVLEGISDENNDNFDTSRYKFAYGVEDHKTGDFKMHQEERDGDVVKGEYTVADADGSLRTVRYTADKHNGFHAVITKAGDPHQEVIPAPAHATTYQSSVKEPLAAPSTHYYNHNSNHEGARYPNDEQIPVKKYIQELAQVAKLYAVKHNKVIENFGSENAAHYQSVDNNKEQMHYSYNMMQADKEKQANAKNFRKQLEVYGQQPIVFHVQKPHGFRKSEDVPIALPLTSQNNLNNDNHINPVNQVHHANHINYAKHENQINNGNLVNHLRLPNHVNQQTEHFQNNDEEISASYNVREAPAEEHEWKQHDSQGKNDRQVNNYKHIFESHFGKVRRPGNDQGAYSYMNFEGETSNGYELQHNFQGKRLIPRE